MTYFRAFFESIIVLAVNQAEVIVNERRSMKLAEEIQGNLSETTEKSHSMKRLWTKNTRKSRLRLRYIIVVIKGCDVTCL